MKKIVLFIIVLTTFFQQKSFSQATTSNNITSLLQGYYSLSNALVKSDAKAVSAMAFEYTTSIKEIDSKLLLEDKKKSLLKDAISISKSSDLNKQREMFSNLSYTLISLAKDLKFEGEIVYLTYCPMKKASWLSNDMKIKNPYYGGAMLTCGQVLETFNK